MSYHFSRTKRFVLFFLGLTIAGIGVALSTRPGLGTSPITSLPYVTTFKFPWTLGMATIVINLFFILAQFIILKRRFGWSHIAQLPTLLAFGFFIDFGMWLTNFYTPESYFLRVAEEVIGCLFLSLGIGFQLIANISLMPVTASSGSYRRNITFLSGRSRSVSIRRSSSRQSFFRSAASRTSPACGRGRSLRRFWWDISSSSNWARCVK